MKEYDRFQNVITYYMKSINASIELMKLRGNELRGQKQKDCEAKLKELIKKKERIRSNLDKVFQEQSTVLQKAEKDLEKIYESAKDQVKSYM